MTLREVTLEYGTDKPLTHINGPRKGEWIMTVRKILVDSDYFVVLVDTETETNILLKENQSKPVDNFTLWKPSTH